MGFEQKCHDSAPPGPRALWPVDLKLTHLDWNPEATLIHFQGQYLTICELDYNILQGEIQNVPKTQARIDIGEFCLVEDVTSARWYRGRVQKQKKDLYDVFLIDHGNVLSVDEAHISSCSNDLFILPPKIVCGFLSSILLLPGCSHSVVEQYFSNLIGRNATGYIQALLPHKVLLLEAPDINNDLVHHGFGKHVDTDTFLLLVEMLTEAPLKQNIEPAPDLLIENQRRQEFFLKPTSLSGYEEILSFCRPRLMCGSHATVYVTAAARPGLFYCQMTDKESELKELSNRLAAVCELKAKINQRRTPDNLGMLCSVKGKDKKWYRGFVQHLPINSLVRVLFVDYGYFESVEVENIHKLPPDFHLTPIMAFPCALSGMSSTDEAHKTQQLGFLKTGLLGGLLEIEINKQEEHLHYITVLSAKELVIPTPIQNATCTKGDSNESEKSFPQNGHLYYETIMTEELDKTLEDEEVQVGSVFGGYVEYVQNPNHFWIRTEKRSEEFEEMMEKLSKHFRDVNLDQDVLENPEPGMLCCAVYEEDMHFYRGVVVDLLEHGAEVLFIDFGNIGKVPHNLIKKIPEEFADKSAFALCCSLVNVVPNDEFWTISASDSFRRLLSNKELQVHVMQMRTNKFDVDLYLVEGGTVAGQSISDLLIATNQAQYGKNISGQWGKISHVTKVRKQNNQPLQNSTKGEDWTEETSAPKVEAKKPIESACLKALNIKPGNEFSVFCPLINSPSDFWCQRLDDIPALEALMMKLQEHYSTKSVPLEPETLCCVVKSPKDSKWCRGIITERQNRRAKVILADFGSNIQVNEDSLQGLVPEYCVLEGQAFRCSLYNVIEPPMLGWSAKASDFLRKFVADSGSSLTCKVISQLNVRNHGLCNVVHLCNTESDQSVSKLLLEHSLARVVTTTLSPAVFPESFVYSSYDLSVGSEELVYVTHVNSHFEVLCQLDKNTAILEEIDLKICEIKKDELASPVAAVEKLCLAKYFDGKWYRGIAYSVQSPSHLCVTFVDYGNTMIAEKKHVIFIPRDSTDLLNTPMQALKFTLALVPQNLVNADVKEWLDATVLNKQMRAVIEANGKDGSFEVELFDGEISINEKLKELIQSLTPKPKIAVTFKTSDKKIRQKQTVNDRYLHKAKSSLKSNTKNRTNYKNKPKTSSQTNRAGVVKSPQMRKTPNKVSNKEDNDTENGVSSAKPQTAPTVNIKTDTDEICHPKQTIYQVSHLPTMKLTEGLKLKCFVTHVDSLSRFYVQLSDDEANILAMVEDLNSKIFRDTLKSISGKMLQVDDLVLAEYEEDGALYRAVVKEAVGFCTFKVEFVDFGNSAIISKEKIYLITKDYISQPRYSIPCGLRDSTAFKNNAAFTDAVMDKPIMVEFICYKMSQWEVKVDILGATTSIPLETVPSKETAVPKKTGVTPEVKRLTLTKQKTAGRIKRSKKKKKSTEVLWKDFIFTAFMPPKIQSGDTHTGLVLSVQSNGDFYVRLCKSSDILVGLETLILINTKNCDVILEKYVKVGLQCLIQEQSAGPWRRAVVQEITHNAFQVLLSDYGKIETVAKNSLRQMLRNLETIPPLAVHCRLNLLRSSQQHFEMCYKAIKATEGKDVKFVFVDISKKEKLWFVEMVMDGPLLMHQVVSAEQLTELDSAIACDRSPGTEVPQKLVFAPVELNKEYFGFAAAVTSPSEFCVVLEDLHLMSQVSILLEDIRDELEPLPRAHLIPGTGCLIRSESKKKWCRAEIRHADSALTLTLVDYGHDECLSHKDHSKLKKLPKYIVELPKMTYSCILKAVRPAGSKGQWTEEAAIFFQQCLDQRNIQIFFREVVSERQWKVDVMDNGVHLAKQLVDAGHGTYTDVMLGLRFQELSCIRSLSAESDDECDEETEDGSRTFAEIEQIFKVESDSKLCMMM